MDISGNFDRFTERARRVLVLAQKEAQRFNHNYIGTEHLLLGLVREGEGVAVKVLSNLDVEPAKIRSAVELIIGRGERQVKGEIGLTPRAKQTIELAVQEARRLGHHYVGTEHLLLGLVREGEGIAAGVLESVGVNLQDVRSEVVRVLTQSGPATQLAGESGFGAVASKLLGRKPIRTDQRTVWQYIVVRVVHTGGSVTLTYEGDDSTMESAKHDTLQKALDVIGEAGWELAGIDNATDDPSYIFKRPK